MSNTYSGVSFPFRFNASGSTTKSSLTPDDFSLIQESLYQIWFTSQSERVMEVDFGASIRAYMFEVNGDETELAILKYEMMKAAEQFEERIIVNDISFTLPEDGDSQTIINVDCTIIKFMTDTTLTLAINMNNT